jgi:hypothetical protein
MIVVITNRHRQHPFRIFLTDHESILLNLEKEKRDEEETEKVSEIVMNNRMSDKQHPWSRSSSHTVLRT